MAAVTGAIIVLNLVLVPRYYRYKSYYCVTKFSTLNLVTGAIIVPRYHLAPTAVFSVLSLPVPSSAKLSTSLVSLYKINLSLPKAPPNHKSILQYGTLIQYQYWYRTVPWVPVQQYLQYHTG